MPYCTNCGHEIHEGEKFCAGCGEPIHLDGHGDNTKRTVVFEGKLHKCPHCGEIISALGKVV